MPVIRIPDDLFERLQKQAVPLVDTTASVIARILDEYENEKSTKKSTAVRSSSDALSIENQDSTINNGSTVRKASSAPRESESASGSLRSLGMLSQRPMHSARPTMVEIDGQYERVTTWAQLCDVFVQWLIDHGKLIAHRLPIYNAAGRGKYFINTRPEHADSTKKANWRRVGDVYVDTKYNGDAHIKNLIATLETLGMPDRSVKIAIDAE